ncbi:NAD-P-binding protein [Mycotypha africana]|uniref:NAD-P-binding protein n=1 Tax=Mycotypha africana TaxID=64632 RepID=UPI0023006B26|nr:NAD-P-binding protein [Mycotypha africana]KAI8982059.1 NAD-P-binding protein [Mycotypha africana]
MSAAWSLIARNFFESSCFAVVGASTSRDKYGNKVLRWYQSFDVDVTPIHPKEKIIEGLETRSSISDLPRPRVTSISVITSPKITLKVLEEAKKCGIPFIWLQPGAEDEKVKEYIQQHFTESMVIYGGPCVLVHGPKLIQEKRKLALL